MQATPVIAVAPQSAGNAAPRTGGAPDAEGVDFSALLVAQIRGGRGADPELLLEAAVPSDLEAVELPLDDLLAQQEPDAVSLPGASSDGLVPLLVGFVPASAVFEPQARSPVLMTALSGRLLEGGKRDSVTLGQTDKGFAAIDMDSLGSGRVAEFAVDGKMLPQSRGERSGEMPTLPVLNVELPRTPDMPVSTQTAMPPAMPSMQAANHLSTIETKSVLPSHATLQVPVGSTGWGDALGQKVVWMAGQQTQVAELRLNPPNLGPMEVRISVSNDQISALFVSHQPAVREAIEAAMPRLREMLAESGMMLGDASVSSDSLPQQQASGREGQPRQSESYAEGNQHMPQGMSRVIPLRQDGSGMVDLFA